MSNLDANELLESRLETKDVCLCLHPSDAVCASVVSTKRSNPARKGYSSVVIL